MDVEKRIRSDNPGAKRLRVICYDIREDGRRGKVERASSAFATRVQKSVFEGWMTNADVDRFLRGVEPLIDRGCDSVRVYTISAAGHSVSFLGSAVFVAEPDSWLVV